MTAATASFDAQADLVVVGYGGAGAAAAITAADRGARVLVVEKQPEDHHTPSSQAAPIVMAVNDVERATDYLDRCADGMVARAISHAWATQACRLVEWLSSLGLDLVRLDRGAQHPMFPGSDALQIYAATARGQGQKVNPRQGQVFTQVPAASETPLALFPALKAAIAERNRVRVWWDSPAQRLIQDESRRVVGVEVETPSGAKRIKAEKGVVLACGGFEYDERLKLNYLKAYPVHFYANPDNTGDGVRMAQAVGADLWHMNQMIGRGIGHFELEDGRAFNANVFLPPGGYVITDKYGGRFANEFDQVRIIEHTFYFQLIQFEPRTRDYPRIPCYWFFDDQRMQAGPLVPNAGADKSLHTWSRDNGDELERGWIKRGSSIREAAALAGVLDPAAAEASVAEYNDACHRGEDRFGRPADSLVSLDQPPYYCVPLYPGGSNTCGGPRRNEHGEIVDPFDNVIPGLFGAGELGEPFGLLYPSSGSNISEALCFGQIVANRALDS